MFSIIQKRRVIMITSQIKNNQQIEPQALLGLVINLLRTKDRTTETIQIIMPQGAVTAKTIPAGVPILIVPPTQTAGHPFRVTVREGQMDRVEPAVVEGVQEVDNS